MAEHIVPNNAENYDGKKFKWKADWCLKHELSPFDSYNWDVRAEEAFHQFVEGACFETKQKVFNDIQSCPSKLIPMD